MWHVKTKRKCTENVAISGMHFCLKMSKKKRTSMEERWK